MHISAGRGKILNGKIQMFQVNIHMKNGKCKCNLKWTASTIDGETQNVMANVLRS